MSDDLKHLDDRYKILFNITPNAIFIIISKAIVDCNAKALELFKCKQEQILGKSQADISPTYQYSGELSTDKAEQLFQLAENDPQSFNWIYKDFEGNNIESEVHLHKVDENGDSFLFAIIHDVTKQKQNEKALHNSEHTIDSLLRAVPIGIGILKNRVYQSVNRHWTETFGYNEDDLIGVNTRHLYESDEEFERVGKELYTNLYVTGISKIETRLARKNGEFRDVVITASPVNQCDESLGAVLIVYDITDRKKIEKDLLESEKKYKEMYNTQRKMLLGIVQALSATVNTRDSYTSGHQTRVSELARAIAEEMNFSEDMVEGIAIAANIHDIGKLGVPSELLSKPTKLDSIEFELIKTHPIDGYDILKKVIFPWPIAEIVYQHHETLDGSGYPRGLKGDQILVEAQIITVADVVEAISSHRPYRPALGMEAALEEIEMHKFTKYNAEVVDVCVKLIREKGFVFSQPAY